MWLSVPDTSVSFRIPLPSVVPKSLVSHFTHSILVRVSSIFKRVQLSLQVPLLKPSHALYYPLTADYADGEEEDTMGSCQATWLWPEIWEGAYYLDGSVSSSYSQEATRPFKAGQVRVNLEWMVEGGWADEHQL